MASQKVNRRTEEIIKSLKDKDKVKVLFVCLGNICRSPAAEGIMREIVERNGQQARWEIDSAGIGNWHAGQLPDQRMRVHARRRGLELVHRARQVRESDFDDFDLIIGMDSGNIADLHELAPSPEAAERIVPMNRWMGGIASRYDHVPDPYYEGAEGFELVLDLLQDSLEKLFAEAGGRKIS